MTKYNNSFAIIITFILIITNPFRLNAQKNNLSEFYRYFINADYDSSRIFLETELKKKPDDRVLHFYLGKTLLALKKYSPAIIHFKKAIKDNKSDAKIYNYIGKIYEEQGMVAEAINSYEYSMRLDSSLSFTKSKLGSLYYKQNRFRASVSILRKLISKDSTNLYAYYLTGRAYLKMAENDSAIQISLKAVKLDSSNFPNLLNLGIGYFSNKTYKTAARILKTAVSLSPQSDETKYYLGITYAKLDQCSKAVSQLEACTDLCGKFKIKSMLFLIEYYYKIGLTRECIRTSKEYLSMGNKQYLSNVYFYIGCSLSDKQNFNQADSSFQKSFKYSDFPLIRNIFFYRGLNFSIGKKYAQAINFYKKTITISPEYPITYYNLAIAYDDFYQDKNPAIRYYQKFLNLLGNDKNNSLLIQAARNRITALKKHMHFKK